MSREVFSLVGRIRAEGFGGLTKHWNKLDKQLDRAVKKIDKFGRDVTKVGVGLTKLTAPIAIVGAAAIKFGADFDDAMKKSIAIMGDLSVAMEKKMATAARNVAKVSTFTAKQAAEAYFFLASAGMNAVEAIAALPRVAKFAQAGAFDLALATDLLTDAQSALGLVTDDAAQNLENMTRVGDVLVKANTLANASVQQFSEALTNKAGAALRMVNKEVEEGVAVLAVYADQGLKGAAAGDALNIVMRDLQKASINNRAAFEEAGVAVFDATGNMRHMGDIIGDLEDHFEGLTDEQARTDLAILGFTDKSISATLALLGTSDAIKEYEDGLLDAGGITNEVAEKQLKSFINQLKLLRNKLVDVGLTLWEAILPTLTDYLIPALEKTIKLVAGAAEWFNNLNPIIKDTAVMTAMFLVVLGPLLIGIGKLISLIKVAKMVFMSFSLVMAANPIGLIVTAIGLLIIAGIALYRNWDIVKEKLGIAWKAIVFATREAVSFIKLAFFGMIQLIIFQLNSMFGLIPGLGKQLDFLSAKVDHLAAKEKLLVAQRRQARAAAKAKIADEKALAAAVEAARKATEEAAAAEEKRAAAAAAKAAAAAAAAAANKERKSLTELAEARKKAAEAAKKQAAQAKELAENRADFEEQWTDKLLQSVLTRKEMLEVEFREALARARELGAKRQDIELFYHIKRLKLAEDEAKKKAKLAKKELDERKEKLALLRDLAIQAVDQLFSILAQTTDNQIEKIDQEADAQKAAIDESVLGEEEKEKQKAAIDEKADKKKRVLMREQAKRDKASAVFAAIVNTFQAVSKALTLGFPLGVIMAVLFGILGFAQVAAIAAEPLPALAGGGVVQRSRGGTPLIAGEGGEDEMILPMQTGVRKVVSDVINGIRSAINGPSLPGGLGASNPAMAGAGGGGVHYHIGTLIADDSGYRELDRRMLKFHNQEKQRKGE